MTLVELVVVLIILAVLLAIAVPSILGQRNRANDAVASARIREAVPSIKAYFQDNATYTGLSVALLRADYDKALPATLAFTSLTATGYCVETVAGGRTWRQNGPGARIERASC